MSEIDAYINAQSRQFEQAVIYNLSAIGEQVVNAARTEGSYKDRTGNLRSSVGYVICVDGRVRKASAFESVRGPEGNGADGRKTGSVYARSLASQFPKGYVLIAVAGMNYASYVSAKGKDVLDSAELLAERLVPQMMKTLGLW